MSPEGNRDVLEDERVAQSVIIGAIGVSDNFHRSHLCAGPYGVSVE